MTVEVEEMLDALSPFCVGPNVYELMSGVRIGLRASRVGDAIYLMKIETHPFVREQGRGNQAMEELCRAADEHGVELFLEVEPFGESGLGEADLVAWYWGFRFRGDKGEMIREPRR